MRTLLITTALFSLLSTAVLAAEPATATAPTTKADDSFLPKEQWDKLSPEEKKARMHARDEKHAAERAEWKKKFEAASPADKQKMIADRKAEHEANKVKWKERYDKASPEEKKKMEDRVAKRRDWEKAHMDKTKTNSSVPSAGQ